MRTLVFVIAVAIATPAMAQRDERDSRLIISDRAIAMGMAMHPPPPAMQSSRDSIKNGTIIGAVIGAVAMGGFVGWLCKALQEPSDPSCWKSVAYAGALGAGAGAAAGAGIDALAARRPDPGRAVHDRLRIVR